MFGGKFRHEEFDVGLGGASLRVRRFWHADGSGAQRPTIVFLHDSLGCITTWRDIPERLCHAAGCDGLIYDREGYGRSSPLQRDRSLTYLHEQADVLGELLERCSVAHSMLLGHSDGGSVALLAAARHAHAVRALITIGAHALVEERTLEGLRRALPRWDDPHFRRRVHRHHGDKAEAVFRVWTQTWLSAQFRAWNIVPELAGVRCPALVIQGEHDEYATERHARIIADAIAGPSEAWIVEGAGHSPHREDARVREVSSEFFAAHAASAT